MALGERGRFSVLRNLTRFHNQPDGALGFGGRRATGLPDSQSDSGVDLRRLAFGASVDYRLGAQEASERVRAQLDRNGIVKVHNFPTEKGALVAFGTTLGPLMPLHGATGTTVEDFIGDVRYRPDMNPQERAAAQRDGELKFHTARSTGVVRPRYFALLMVDPGWTNQPPGNNGESRFASVQDALAEMKKDFPDTFAADLQLLTTTPVRFTATLRPDAAAADMPILFPVDNKTIGLRYKEDMDAVLAQLGSTLPNGDRYLAAAHRFDHALQTAPSIEIPLGPGELVLMDNRFVAHARRPFLPEKSDSTGSTIYNPRHLYNANIMPEHY